MRTWFLFFCIILIVLSSCGGNFAPIIDKGNKYYGREETKKDDDIDEILHSLS